MSGVRDTLSTQTRDVHERLHHHPVLVDLLSPHIAPPYYVRVLKSFYAFYSALHTHVGAAGFSMPAVIENGLEDLKADLNMLGITHVLLPCSIKTELRSQDALLGVLYVLEGSNLGGQMIAKHIRRNLGLTQSCGLRFFSGHGKETALHWSAFLTQLESQVQDHDICSQAAQSLFEDLERYLWRVYDQTMQKDIITKGAAA